MAQRSVRWFALLLLFVCASAAGAQPANESPGACRVDDTLVLAGAPDSGAVALTFDACPTSRTPGFSPDILATLQREHVAATIFVSGRWAEKHADVLRQLAATPGIELALHGHRHRHLDGATAAATAAEIEAGRAAMVQLGVMPAPLFRPPFGEHPATLAAAARQAGVTPILWDVVTGDPDPHVTAAAIEHTVQTQARAGSIVVMHINGRGVSTAAALPTVIAGLRARGLQLVSVGELIKQCRLPSDSTHAAKH